MLFRSATLNSLLNSDLLTAAVSKYRKFPFPPSCVVVGRMAGARLLCQYLLAGLSCTVIKIQLVGSDKMLMILMDFHLFGNKIRREVFRAYLENLHESYNFYDPSVLMTSCVRAGVMVAYSDEGMVEPSPDINRVFRRTEKIFHWFWRQSGGQKTRIAPLKNWVQSLLLIKS